MNVDILICGVQMNVEYDFDITSSGSGGTAPSLTYPGDAAEPAEFDIHILSLSFPEQADDVHLDIPTWLKELLTTHLLEREDINTIVQQADQDRWR